MKSATTRIVLHRVFAILVIAIIAAGCTREAKFRLESGHGTSITRQQLRQNWSNYFIHYNTRIVVFDPVFDRLTIQVGDGWALVEYSKELDAIFQRLDLMSREGLTDIYQIVDSQGILYGYLIYASGDIVSFKKIDENKIKIYYQPRRSPDAP